MDRQMQEVLNKFSELGPLPIEQISPQVARQLPELKDAVIGVLQDHITKRAITGVVEPVWSIEHLLIPGGDEQILARIYRPKSEGPHPVILYFHGGGFVFGNLNTYDSSCRALTNACEAIVVSVAYRQAPEYPYPAAHEDAYAAYKWLLNHAVVLGGHPAQIAVAGESAGGNLAASICLWAKKESIQRPVHQLLIYPLVDSDINTPSYLEHANAKPLNREMMKWFFDHVKADENDPLVLPLKSNDLSDLSPATIITAEIDPLCSEGEAYAEKLSAAMVPVKLRRFEGVTHEFFGMGAVVDQAREAVKFAAEELNNSFEAAISFRESFRNSDAGLNFEQP